MPEQKLIYTDQSVRSKITTITILGILLAVVCILSAFFLKEKSWVAPVIIAIWGIGPPLWSFIEYHCFFRPSGNVEAFDEFKYSQGLVTKIWVAVGLVIAAGLSDLVA